MNLAATMSLDNRGFLGPLSAAQSGVNNSVAGMRSAFTGLQKTLALVGISFAAFKTGEGFVEGVKSVAAMGKELKGLSEVTHTGIKDIVVLRKAFDDVGIGADAVQQNLVMMKKSLGGVNEAGEPTKYVFSQIGLSIDALKKMGTTEQLTRIGGAIMGLGDQERRTAATTAIFGRAGADMFKLFSNPEAIKEAAEAVGMQGEIYARSAVRFAAIANALDSLSKKVKGFFLGFTDTLSPVLLPILEKLKSSMNFVGIGQKLGATFATIAQSFKTGDFGELFFLGLQAGLTKFLAALVGTVSGLSTTLSAVFGNEKLVGGMRDGLVAAAEAMGAVLLRVFQDAFVSLESNFAAWRASIPKSLGGTKETEKEKAAIERNEVGQQSAQAQVELDAAEKRSAALMLQNKAYKPGTKEFTPEYAAARRDEEEKTKRRNELSERYERLTYIASGTSTKSADDFRKDILANGGATLFGKNAGALEAGAKAHGDASIAQLRDSKLDGGALLKMAMQEFAKSIQSIKPAPEIQKQLDEVWNKINATITKDLGTPETAGSDGAGGAGIAVGKAPKLEGDRLAKIGMFIGAGGPENDYARRTADNTQKIAEGIRTIASRAVPSMSGFVPSWGA